jgi:hypothetical protein
LFARRGKYAASQVSGVTQFDRHPSEEPAGLQVGAMPGMFGLNASRCSHYFGDRVPACPRRLRRSCRPEYSSLHLRPIGFHAAIGTAAERMDHTAPIEQEDCLVI